VPFGSRPETEVSSVLELVRRFRFTLLSRQRFVVVSASPSLPPFHRFVNSFVFLLLPSRSSSLIAVATRRGKSRGPRNRILENRYCAKIRKINLPQIKMRSSQFWLARPINIWDTRVLQWNVLCGIPYRGSGALASPVPTNRLPTYPITEPLRAGHLAFIGSTTALKQLSESIKPCSHLQACHIVPCRLRSSHLNCFWSHSVAA
jgi:hypothetical protein